MKRCPRCGSESFYVSAHVVQDWIVDSCGDYLKTVDDCVEVVHFPQDDDLWECAKCGYNNTGSKFNIEEE